MILQKTADFSFYAKFCHKSKIQDR